LNFTTPSRSTSKTTLTPTQKRKNSLENKKCKLSKEKKHSKIKVNLRIKWSISVRRDNALEKAPLMRENLVTRIPWGDVTWSQKNLEKQRREIQVTENRLYVLIPTNI